MSSNITYKESLNKAYLKGFFEMLDTILDKGEKKEQQQREDAVQSPNNSKRDQLVPIYMYCKNLWDKWLIHPTGDGKDYATNPFTVEKFFKNFLFIDSFYRNIYNLLPVNCQKFMDLVESLTTSDTADAQSLYSFIGFIARDCRCLFVAVPDYINLGTVDNDGKMHEKGLENMSKIFRCVPHNEMRKIETDNKFIVIYTHEPSKNQDDSRGFQNDTINICDNDGQLTDQAKELFGGITPPTDADGTKDEIKLNNMTANAYPVPSFAVAFSGHNNHIFKAVDVNMDNPIATEHSIQILSNIAQLGSGNGQKVAYQGQDVFPIFSNYAYQSTITMMGNAQIQPLMYYQLMNIPMWKGAYMIFNVRHTIVPGNMTTTFTGMKMSKNCVPFLEKWVYPVECVVPETQGVVMSSDASGGNGQSVITGESYNGQVMNCPIYGQYPSGGKTSWLKTHCGLSGDYVPSASEQSNFTTSVSFKTRRGATLTMTLHKDITEQFLSAWNEILAQPIQFDVFTTSHLRRSKVKSGRPSNHCWGVAFDFNPDFNGHISAGWGVHYDPVKSLVPAELQTSSGSVAKQRINDGTFKNNNPNYIVVEIMAKYGFGWGGSYTDYMHFSWFGGH